MVSPEKQIDRTGLSVAPVCGVSPFLGFENATVTDVSHDRVVHVTSSGQEACNVSLEGEELRPWGQKVLTLQCCMYIVA